MGFCVNCCLLAVLDFPNFQGFSPLLHIVSFPYYFPYVHLLVVLCVNNSESLDSNVLEAFLTRFREDVSGSLVLILGTSSPAQNLQDVLLANIIDSLQVSIFDNLDSSIGLLRFLEHVYTFIYLFLELMIVDCF